MLTVKEIKELAGHRAVPPWIVKLVNDACKVAVEHEHERIIKFNKTEIDKCNSYIKELEDKLARSKVT